MQATKATFFNLPLAISRVYKSRITGLHRIAESAGMYKAFLTVALPPQIACLPLCLPLSRFKGATPTRADISRWLSEWLPQQVSRRCISWAKRNQLHIQLHPVNGCDSVLEYRLGISFCFFSFFNRFSGTQNIDLNNGSHSTAGMDIRFHQALLGPV
jgi:hypothetical protein